MIDHTHKRLFVGTVAATFIVVSSSASGQFMIDPASNMVVGSRPSGVAAADFDNDGDIDLATTTDAPDRIDILVNNGDGTYSLGPAAALPASSSPQDIIAGDFNGDGLADLAVAVRDPAGAVIMMTNLGGTFALGSTTAVGDRPRGLSAADMDGDGDLDIAVANRNDNNASVLTNTGGGAFTAATIAVGGETRSTAFVDIDGDGDMDLAVTNHDARTVALFTNTGGAFAASGSLGVGPFVRPDGLTSADFNGDGRDDLAAAVSDQTLGINQAAVYLNTGGAFAGPANYDTGGTNTSGITGADLDCDGAMDIITSNANSANVSMLQNTGGGVFGAAQLAAAGTTPDQITAADFDGDGDADFATANRDSNSISVFINQTCKINPPLVGDINGDGVVNVQDLLLLLADWGSCAGCPADLNGDGLVNVTDLLLLLSNWS